MQKIGFLIVLLASLLSGCNKSENNSTCVEIGYDQMFNLESDIKYCLPDGNWLMAISITNEYCPCHAVCIWEGEFWAHIHYQENGLFKEIEFHEGSQDIEEMPGLNFYSYEVTFVEDCSEIAPNPDIKEVQFLVKNI